MLLLPASTHQVVVILITVITTVATTIAVKLLVITAIIAIEMHQVVAFIIKKLLLSIINHHLQSLILANN